MGRGLPPKDQKCPKLVLDDPRYSSIIAIFKKNGELSTQLSFCYKEIIG